MKKHIKGIAVYAILLIAIFAIYSFMSYEAAPATITFSELIQHIEDGNVEEIKIITDGSIVIHQGGSAGFCISSFIAPLFS